MVKNKVCRISGWYYPVLFLIIGSLNAHPGKLTSFDEIIHLLRPSKSAVGKIADKKTLASLFTSTSPVVLQVGFSSGVYAQKLLKVCASLSTTLTHIRFCALADELTVPFLHYVGSKLHVDKVELPCLIMIHKGELVLPIVAGFLQKSQLQSLLVEHFGMQPATGAVDPLVR